MNEQFHPVKIGGGDKVHAARIRGYTQKGHYSEPQPIYDFICGCVNTKHINRRLRCAPLQEGEPVTCEKCLARISR